MFRRNVLALSLAFAAAGAARADIDIDIGRGPVTIHIPDSYDPAVPAPLVVILHGYGGSGDGMKAWLDLDALSEQHGLLFCAPDGTKDNRNLQFWNATDACCDFNFSGVDDSGYLRALVEEVQNQLNVAPRRVHFFGHSNGGFMCYRMACDHADLVASFASLAGANWWDPSDCPADQPVHALQIHGTSDDVILYQGGTLQAPYPSARGSVIRWVDVNGCTRQGDDSHPNLDLDSSIAGDETEVLRWVTDCEPGGSGELWSIITGGHFPVLSPDFSPHVVDWFLAHPKPGLWEDRGHALAGTHGEPLLIGEGTLIGGEEAVLRATGALENTPAFLAIGTSELLAPFAGGILVPAPDLIYANLATDASGELHLTGTWPVGIAPGTEFYYQCWFADPVAIQGFSATNGLLSITP